MPEDEIPENFGYSKPPKSGRFVKGKSGNPNGRPKGSRNFATMILHESRKKVRINGSGGTRSVTKLEAALMQLCNEAAQGKPRAQRELFSLVRMCEEASGTGGSPQTSREKDQKVIKNILRRIDRISAEAASTKPDPEKEKS